MKRESFIVLAVFFVFYQNAVSGPFSPKPPTVWVPFNTRPALQSNISIDNRTVNFVTSKMPTPVFIPSAVPDFEKKERQKWQKLRERALREVFDKEMEKTLSEQWQQKLDRSLKEEPEWKRIIKIEE